MPTMSTNIVTLKFNYFLTCKETELITKNDIFFCLLKFVLRPWNIFFSLPMALSYEKKTKWNMILFFHTMVWNFIFILFFLANDSFINELAQKSRKSQVKTSHEFAKEIPFIKPANKFSKKLNQKHVHCSHLLKPSAGTYCLRSSVLW